VSNIELLLNYCDRFYDRQFITRDNTNKGILEKFEVLLNNYFGTDKPLALGLHIAAHVGINFFVGWVGVLFQQGTGTHNLPCLAVPALGNIVVYPGFLYRMRTIGRQPLDGCNGLFAHCRNRQLARPHRRPVEVNGAGTTHGHATAKLGAGHIEVVAQHPQNRRCRFNVYRVCFAVNFQVVFCHNC
jgi:hypothetical protein